MIIGRGKHNRHKNRTNEELEFLKIKLEKELLINGFRDATLLELDNIDVELEKRGKCI